MQARRSKIALIVLVGVVIAGGCDESDDDRSNEVEQSQEAPRWLEPSNEAEQLAARVHTEHGGEKWDDVERLSFRFVLQSDGEEQFGATHDWNVADGTNRVRWSDDVQHDVTVDLDSRRVLEATVDGQAIEDDQDRLHELGEDAYRRWVNDSYWLLMPIKLFDPGVNLAFLDTTDEDVEILELRFDGVGLTPGDRYEVRVDSQSARILSWKLDLEGREETSVVEWSDYRQFDPLKLPVERGWTQGERKILFEDVEVSETQ